MSVAIDDLPATLYRCESARDFAVTIREVVDGAASPDTIKVGAWFRVQRVGNGFKIHLRMGGPEVTLSGDLARDLADLIEKAAI